MRSFLAAHKRVVWSVALAVVAGVVFVLVWFQPHKLVIDEKIDEKLPGAAQAGERDPSHDEGRSEGSAMTLAAGSFRSLEHTTSGRASIVELPDGRRYLRLEDLETSNGPDLRVYLSEIPASDDWYAYGERFVDLGALKGNIGNQNYALPADLDLGRYRSAVIWCRRFTVGFGVAGLERS